jgi:hypothetical protein
VADLDTRYRDARSDAQARANETGYDYGIELNELFKTWHVFMLPMKKHRCGHELRCEVVMCDDVKKCRPGHGPDYARRVP